MTEQEWQPTMHLRFRVEYDGDDVVYRLQQKWARPVIDRCGALSLMDEEWRYVETDYDA